MRRGAVQPEERARGVSEREHAFVVIGEGTRESPKRLRCRHCNFTRAVMSDHGNLGCHDGLREHYLGIDRDRFDRTK